ncbi:EpsD family peptidyl-prolyl cis-trans isomerase [Novosphingobium sp. SG751A]|uniref:hypothetical protein n=1 Tax=Novosphingobium sp. SG751A TaxID=2587000 RepID=UPI0015566379|nr:hypothetical protein [Novosphingobium sp. SG751A]NOW47684.1 EpsD family peptidyl-prolyl cis-trans isomerase [Novosphingobium sp. SG751A]
MFNLRKLTATVAFFLSIGAHDGASAQGNAVSTGVTSTAANNGARNGAVIATVNGIRIFDEDLSRRLQEEHGPTRVSQDVRLQTLKTMMAEVAVDAAFGKAIRSDPQLQAALESQRRKFVLAAYDSSRLQGVEVSPREVDDFIAAHPDYFAGRRTYHYSRADLTALTPNAQAEMTSRLPEWRKQAGMTPGEFQLNLVWAQNPAFRIGMSRNWDGSEQIQPEDLAVLKQLDAAPGKVSVQCKGESCHLLVLHGAYADPVDPSLLREALAAQLRQVKSAQVIERANAELLARADVKVDDAAMAAAMARASSSLTRDENPMRRRLIWSAQILALLGSVACAVLIFTKQNDKYRTPSYLVVISYERYVRITCALLLPLGVGFLGLVVLGANPMVRPAIDTPVIAGLTLCAAGLAVMTWRHARDLRLAMRRRRYGLVLLLAAQGALLASVF